MPINKQIGNSLLLRHEQETELAHAPRGLADGLFDP